LEPLVLVFIGAICDRVALSQRRRSGLLDMPMILMGEWRMIGLVLIVAVVFVLLQLTQIGLM
jgi:hypothetical protein